MVPPPHPACKAQSPSTRLTPHNSPSCRPAFLGSLSAAKHNPTRTIVGSRSHAASTVPLAPSFPIGTRVAETPSELIVRTEWAAFVPGVTDEGEVVQLGIGAGPTIEQETVIALSNDVPSGSIVRLLTIDEPRFRVKLEASAAKMKFGPTSNVAVAA